MKRLVAVAIVLLTAGQAALAVEPQEDLLKVTMDGRAPGTGTEARSAAILSAEREIILKAIEGIIPKPDLVALRSVLERAPLYIVPAPLLMKYDHDADTTRVEIEARVRIDSLRRDIARCVLPRLTPPRKVLVLIAQAPSAGGKLSIAKAGSAETAARQALAAIRLDTVDGSAVRAAYSPGDLLRRMQGNAAAVAKLAQENLADVAIVGTATVSHGRAPGESNILPCRAVITVRIVRANDAKIVDSWAVDALVYSVKASEGAAQAMADACAKLKEKIGVPAVLAAAGATPSDDVIIDVPNPPSGGMVHDFLRALRAKAGVETAEKLLVTARLARLRVKYTGSMASLDDYITSQAFAGVRLESKWVVGRRMIMEIAKQDGDAR